MLRQRSPLYHADRVRRPVLIGQGSRDRRVSKSHSDRMVAALQSRRVPVTYTVFPDEGHQLDRPANRKALWAVAEAFLGKHLGGRVEPIGDDLEDSSIQIPVGVALVPGLAKAAEGR